MYAVEIKNFITNKYEVLKLHIDPRTGEEGLAIYDKREDASWCAYIAYSMAVQGSIKLRVRKLNPTTKKEDK
jgi:hypothetical protein